MIYDSDWNLQTDIQAQPRRHRIGQKRRQSLPPDHESGVRGGNVPEVSKKLALDYALLDAKPHGRCGDNGVDLSRRRLR
jgi:hypothetical protein